jgi:hypothetical protein
VAYIQNKNSGWFSTTHGFYFIIYLLHGAEYFLRIWAVFN